MRAYGGRGSLAATDSGAGTCAERTLRGLADCFRLLKNRAVLLSTLGVACFIAADVGIGFLSVRLIDNPSSILTTTGFYACRIVGTLIGAWVLVKVSDVKYLTWNMTGALALCAALLFVRNEAAIYAAVGVLGFAMACVFATFYAVATKAVPENANEVAGLMIMAISGRAFRDPSAVRSSVPGAIRTWACSSSPRAWPTCSGRRYN